MTTAEAVAEMVNAAFRAFGGEGDAGAVRLRRRNENERSHCLLDAAQCTAKKAEAASFRQRPRYSFYTW